MKPLATPVLGGMVSSLVHVLVVTPVIFFWLRERQLGLQGEEMPTSSRTTFPWRTAAIALVVIVLIVAAVLGWRTYQASGSSGSTAGLTIVQEVTAGDLRIVLLSPTGPLRQGRNTYTIEFRSSNGALVDVGTVKSGANMTMPGMVMTGATQIQPTSVAGRYEATAEFAMAGTWQMSLEWDGPAGRGSTNFEGSVQ